MDRRTISSAAVSDASNMSMAGLEELGMSVAYLEKDEHKESLNNRIVEAELADGVAPAVGSVGHRWALCQPTEGQDKECTPGRASSRNYCVRSGKDPEPEG